MKTKPEAFMRWKVDFAGQILGTGYQQFFSRSGIDGLARVRENTIELLAMVSNDPGKGQFRNFIAALKKQYDAIYVWVIWNEDLIPVLERYGFETATLTEEIQGVVETVTGMKWQNGSHI